MHIEERTLDVSKKDGRSGQIKPIILRKGEENQTQIKINLTSNGEPYSVGNLTPRFCAILPDKKYVRDASHVTKSTNYVTYTVQSDLTSADGDIRVAYIELQSSGNSLTSDNLPIIVLDNTDISQEKAEEYQSQIDALVKDLENSINKANNAASNASSAATSANNAASSANSAKTNAQNAANSANTAASAADNAAMAADKATSKANTAAEAANEAKQAVDEAMGKFTTVTDSEVKYQVGTSGTTPPTGTWLTEPPTVPQGQYLWVRNTTSYNKGNPTVAYAVAFQGRDGSFAGNERIETLEEKVENINDYTTGINLLRGTRDFRIGETKYHSINAYIDGFYNQGQFTFYKDSDGFTVANLKKSGTSTITNDAIRAFVLGDFKSGSQITISFDFMIDNMDEYDETNLLIIDPYKNGAVVTSSTYVPVVKVTPENVTSKNWYRGSYTYNVPSNIDGLVLNFALRKNGSINFKKIKAEIGRINHTIYSVAPADLALEPINDITTGINLLRGTREFRQGTIYKAVGNVADTFFEDGFGFVGKYEKYIDDEGFTVLHMKNSGLTQDAFAGAYASVIQVNPKDELTVSFEFMVENVSEWDRQFVFNYVGRYDNESANVLYGDVTLSQLEIPDFESNKWYSVNYKISASTITKPVQFRIRLFLVRNGSIYFRKPCVYKGKIEHAEWNANPFDYASSQVELSAPHYLGYLPDTHIIKSGEDVNNYTIPGEYACASDSDARNIRNIPQQYAFRLSVSSATGKHSVSTSGVDYYYLRQVFTVYVESAVQYYRYKKSSDEEWTPWRLTYANTTVRPIEGGGTSATTAIGAQHMLLANMAQEDTPADVNSYVMFAYQTPTATQGAVYKRRMSKVMEYIWEYIQAKIEATYNVAKK